MDLKAIGKFLGHGNLSTTKRYSHPDDRIKQNVANAYQTLIKQGKDNPEPLQPKPQTQQSKRFVVKRKKVQKVSTEKNSIYKIAYTIP